jgi:hypothetical protein
MAGTLTGATFTLGGRPWKVTVISPVNPVGQAALLVEFDDGGLGIGPQLSSGAAEGVGRLPGMAPLNETARHRPTWTLKSGWRHEDAPPCRNCDRPTLLTVFGYSACGFYKRGPTVVRICPPCVGRFEDHSPWDGPGWLLANLDGPLLTTGDLMFGHPVKWALPWTAEGQAHQAKVRQGIET